jgi:hypothetical protein
MRMENKVLAALAAAVLSLAPLSLAHAVVINGTVTPEETPQQAPTIYVDMNPDKPAPNSTQVNTTIYDNTTSTTALAFSSTDLTMTWGDEVTTTGTGLLSGFKFSVFNSGSSAGTLTGATFSLKFYDLDASGALIGGYSGSVSFSTALGKGFYSVISSTNLDANNIVLNSTHLLVTQKVSSKTGSASRLGIVSLDPVVIGSSPAYFYESGAATTAGYYTSASGNVNPIYNIEVAPPPVGVHSTSWGSIKKLYR